ncbi:hypothetical protein [Clostridium estertheticum]|uniref:Uncharacterized protein n=1 Tax=Clostridium estertheticum TaxID=238834 RepID=A0A5N7J2J3_9CLOT|nr:hypothetical protein [Clostridium estertheticum]MBU3169954.1 hypothetical protein [Clostridium estertheticum]MPQ32244.1 hypothetical protein [Clostridium estertheticum]MPQ62903.1 hypothetical protein [Clostridium estertheticum]
MKREYLELKTCRTEKAEFIKEKEYIVLDTTTEYTYEYDFNTLPCYRVINEKGGVEIVVPDQIFYPTHRLMQSIKDVVYIGVLDIDDLVEGEVYSVFKMNEEKEEPIYTIFNDSNKLMTYYASLFVTEDKYLKMTKEELYDFKKVKKEELLQIDDKRKKEAQKLLDQQLEVENAKKRDIQNSLDEKERLRNIKNSNNLEIEKFKELIKILRPNKVENTTNTLMFEINKIKNKFNKLSVFFISGFGITVISSIFGNGLLSLVISIIYLITGVSSYLYLKNNSFESLIKTIPTSKKLDKESLNLMVSFSDDILLKLKKIELNLLILETGATISSGTVSLIRESVSFCLESYKTKDTNLLKDIYAFLDKTLEYIYSLIDGDNSAEEYIEKQIYENVSSIIKRNTDIFELMISDNKEIKEIMKKSN